MNPSQNNSFGSFGNNSGDFGGAQGGYGGGQGGDFGGVGRPVISSGGDAGYDAGAGLAMPRQRGRKKWMIVAGVVLILLAVGLGVGVVVSRGNQKSSDISAARTAYNSYVNYVIFGTDNTNDIDENTFKNADGYFLDGDNLDLEAYLKKEESLYESLEKLYYDNGGVNDMNKMAVYFYGYAASQPLNEETIWRDWYNDGIDVVKKIDSYYSSKYLDEVIAGYFVTARDLAMIDMNNAVTAKEAGCATLEDALNSCLTQLLADRKGYLDKSLEMDGYVDVMRSEAFYVLKEMYYEIYGVEVQ